MPVVRTAGSWAVGMAAAWLVAGADCSAITALASGPMSRCATTASPAGTPRLSPCLQRLKEPNTIRNSQCPSSAWRHGRGGGGPPKDGSPGGGGAVGFGVAGSWPGDEAAASEASACLVAEDSAAAAALARAQYSST